MRVIDAEQGTSAWLRARQGIPTASEAHRLVTPTGKPARSKDNGARSYARQLAADTYAGCLVDHFGGSDATERGLELEPRARRAYAFAADVALVTLGFALADDGRYGASLDAMRADAPIPVEIKCPLGPRAVEAIVHAADRGAPLAAYLPQLHMQMLVADAPALDHVIYHPLLPLSITRVERSAEWDRVLLEQITLCVEERRRVLERLVRLAERHEGARAIAGLDAA